MCKGEGRTQQGRRRRGEETTQGEGGVESEPGLRVGRRRERES